MNRYDRVFGNDTQQLGIVQGLTGKEQLRRWLKKVPPLSREIAEGLTGDEDPRGQQVTNPIGGNTVEQFQSDKTTSGQTRLCLCNRLATQ